MNEDEFLRSLRADPDDGLLWSAYADWSGEQGAALSDLIHASLRLTELHESDADSPPLLREIKRLRVACIDANEIAVHDGVTSADWHHGMLIPALPVSELAHYESGFTSGHYLGASLIDVGDATRFPDDCDNALLRQFRVLRHGNAIPEATAARLSDASLESLWGLTTGCSGVPDFGTSPHALSGLRHLDTSATYTMSAINQHTTSIPVEWVSRLRTLTLAPGVSERFINSMVDADAAINLHTLRFQMGAGDEFDRWLKKVNAPQLKHLEFRPDQFGTSTSSIPSLTAGPLPSQLETLSLLKMSGAALGKLARKRFPKLKRLGLALSSLSPAVIRAVHESEWFSTLQTLSLSASALILNRGFDDLLRQHPSPDRLTSLHVTHENLPDAVCHVLADEDVLPKLARLRLIQISPAGMLELLQSDREGLDTLELFPKSGPFKRLEREELPRGPLLNRVRSLTLSASSSMWHLIPDLFGDGPVQLEHLRLIDTDWRIWSERVQGQLDSNFAAFASALLDSPLMESLTSLEPVTPHGPMPFQLAQSSPEINRMLRVGGFPLRFRY